MKSIYTFLFFFPVWLMNLTTLEAQSVDLTPSMDNTIYSESDSSNGSGIYLFTGITRQGGERRALLKFDLTSILPVDSVISAELQLYQSKTIEGPVSVSLYRLTGDWGEGASDAVFEEGMGATPSSDDATWNLAFYDSVSWDSPGGDFIAEASSTTTIDQSGVYYSWTGDGLASDVRTWIANPAENFGWIVITAGEEVSAKRFNSRENSSNKPNLILQLFTTSFENNIISGNFNIYPNPSKGTVHIKGLLPDKTYQIDVNEISGRQIFQKEIKVGAEETVSFTIPGRGVYFIIINSVSISKVIII